MDNVVRHVFGSRPREVERSLLPPDEDAQRVEIAWQSIRNQVKWLSKRREPEDITFGLRMIIDEVLRAAENNAAADKHR